MNQIDRLIWQLKDLNSKCKHPDVEKCLDCENEICKFACDHEQGHCTECHTNNDCRCFNYEG